MIKQAPTLGRILAMVVFTLSCFGLLLFLWLAFGGPIPLRPEGYRLKVAFPEAATLAQEADVRLAGVNVGKVKSKELDKRAARTLVELELSEPYAPIPRDSRAMLRQKTLLGETYVELSPGDKRSGLLSDGARLPNGQIEPTVELDEIFGAFDPPTRAAFKQWVAELAQASKGRAAQDLNDAFGNLAPFAADGAALLRVLDEQGTAVRQLIRNTGRVFGAINEREGALRQLIVNSNNTFEATASRDEELAETFEVFPTFLDESRVTLARLERFARDTRPLVNELKRPAADLGPTVRDLGRLAPDLERLFRDLPPLIRAADRGAPALQQVLREAEPLLEAAHVFFPELNPILAYANYYQATIAGFISVGAHNINRQPGHERANVLIGMVDGRSFEKHVERPEWERGNAYLAPNALTRAQALGTVESFDCDPSGGEVRDPVDAENVPPPEKNAEKRAPCFVQPPSLLVPKKFALLGRGEAPLVRAPRGLDGRAPARPDR